MYRRGRLHRRNRVAWTWFVYFTLSSAIWAFYFGIFRDNLNDGLSLFLGLEGISSGVFVSSLVTPGRRRVVIVAKARNSFTAMIEQGLTERLRQHQGWDIIPRTPPMVEAAESSHGVTELLGSLDARNADAIVCVAGDVDEHLHMAVLERIREGITVITCDARLDDDYFFGHDMPPPRYVGSNFTQGGREVANYIRQRAAKDDLIFVFCGPSGNRPAVERGRVALYELMLSEYASSVHTVPIRSFERGEVREKFTRLVLQRIEALGHVGRVFVYCGNDENAQIIESCIQTANNPKVQYQLVGYDGVRTPTSSLMVESCQHVVATVNTLPQQLGQSAADMLLAVRGRSAEADRKALIINPTLWERS